MTKCEGCGTNRNVKKIKHLPLANGRSGHITLTNWTHYCADCIKSESEKLTQKLDEAKG